MEKGRVVCMHAATWNFSSSFSLACDITRNLQIARKFFLQRIIDAKLQNSLMIADSQCAVI